MNEVTLRALRDDELMHYGVIGMKWGVRRYQPYPSDYHGDGKFTGSKRQMKKEFRKDNRRLREAVRDASIAGAAYSMASSSANKADRKRLSKPSDRNNKKAEFERLTAAVLERHYKKMEKEAQNAGKIAKDAVSSWVNDNYSWLKQNYPNLTKQQIQNGLEVSEIYSNGRVNIQPKKTAKQLQWLGLPSAEIDMDTGKVIRTSYDD